MMQRALTLISSKDACNASLGCDPCLLLLLILDPVSVLDAQVPVGLLEDTCCVHSTA